MAKEYKTEEVKKGEEKKQEEPKKEVRKKVGIDEMVVKARRIEERLSAELSNFGYRSPVLPKFLSGISGIRLGIIKLS